MYYRLEGRDPPNWLRILRAKKYRRACGVCWILLIFIFFISAIAGYAIFNYQHNYLLDDFTAKNDDVVILSATYYEKSKSFPDNTVVLLLNSHQFLHVKYPELQIVSSNPSRQEVSTVRVEQVVPKFAYYCHWVPYLAIGQVVENMDSLEISNDPRSRENGAAIKFRRPYTENHKVVSCFTPMFMADRWQGILVTAEVFSHYGAFMHFYVRSMITPEYEMLKVYPNTRISPWPAVKLGERRAKEPGFDPNVELEFRNQASAMTDCLLMYKDNSEFIIFPDADEVIIPRLGPDYYSEFLKVFHENPNAAAMAYNMTQTKFKSAILPQTFSPGDVLDSIEFTGQTRWGKLVVKPSRVDSLWIHRAYGIKEGYEQVEMPLTENSMVHIRVNEDQEERINSTGPSKYNPFDVKNNKYDLIPRKDLEEIQLNFEKRVKENKEVYEALPSQLVYYALIDQCYDARFYNGESHSLCKGPEMCSIPRFPGIHCVNTMARFETFAGYNHYSWTGYRQLFVHILEGYEFEQSWDGCRL